MKHSFRPLDVTMAALILGGSLVASEGARASVLQVQRIATLGERVGDILIDDHFDVDGLNDNGQLLFVTANADGDERLMLYDGTQLISIAAPGGNAPGG